MCAQERERERERERDEERARERERERDRETERQSDREHTLTRGGPNGHGLMRRHNVRSIEGCGAVTEYARGEDFENW